MTDDISAHEHHCDFYAPDLEEITTLKQRVKTYLCNVPSVPPGELDNVINLAEKFRLVSRQGMSAGMRLPGHQQWNGSGDMQVVLKHVYKEAQRAERHMRNPRSCAPRQNPLYGRHAPKEWRPLIP